MKMNNAVDFINLSNQSFTRKEVVVTDVCNRKHKILIDQKFRKTKIRDMIQDYIETDIFCKENDAQIGAETLTYIKIIKHFTNISFPKGKDKKEEFMLELKLFEALVDLEITEQIFENIDSKEFEKTMPVLKNVAEQIEKEQVELLDTLEIEEIAEME